KLLWERETLIHPEPPHQDRDDRVRGRKGDDDRDRPESDRQEDRNPGDAEEEQRRNRLADPGSIPGAALANASGGDGQVDGCGNEHVNPGIPREAERVDRHALEDSPRAPETDREEHRGEPGSPSRIRRKTTERKSGRYPTRTGRAFELTRAGLSALWTGPRPRRSRRP